MSCWLEDCDVGPNVLLTMTVVSLCAPASCSALGLESKSFTVTISSQQRTPPPLAVMKVTEKYSSDAGRGPALSAGKVLSSSYFELGLLPLDELAVMSFSAGRHQLRLISFCLLFNTHTSLESHGCSLKCSPPSAQLIVSLLREELILSLSPPRPHTV